MYCGFSYKPDRYGTYRQFRHSMIHRLPGEGQMHVHVRTLACAALASALLLSLDGPAFADDGVARNDSYAAYDIQPAATPLATPTAQKPAPTRTSPLLATTAKATAARGPWRAVAPADSTSEARHLSEPESASHPSVSAQAQPSDTSGNLIYNGGPVERAGTQSYAIFWQPAGSFMSVNYRPVITRYLQNVGGSSLYGLLTQYFDTGGNIQNSSSLAGSWLDTSSQYPGGIVTGIMFDSDVQAEVLRAINANNWPPVEGANYFVYVGQGEDLCAFGGCTRSQFCGYHSSFGVSDGVNTFRARYAFVHYPGGPQVDTAGCDPGAPYPNGDRSADIGVSITSSQQMAMITDPEECHGITACSGRAWRDSAGNDIAAKCLDHPNDYTTITRFGNRDAQGANVSLNGNSFIVQEEWSNADGDCALNPAGPVSTLPAPVRLVDTRLPGGGPIPSGTSRCFPVAGAAGVPASAGAVVLNVTAVGYGTRGWLTIYPNGQPVPGTSTLNFDPDEYAIADGTLMRIGSGGQVCVNVGTSGNAPGSSQVVLDATGYLTVDQLAQLPMLTSPQRLVDTRTTGGPIATGQSRCFTVAGAMGVPSDAAAVVLNLTAVGYSAKGWLTAFPAGQAVPATSTVNFDPSEYAIANVAIVRIGSNGQICVNVGTVDSAAGSSQVVVDITGYLTAAGIGEMPMLNGPQRLVDTRLSGGAVGTGQTRCFATAGQIGIPASARAVVLNLTAAGYGAQGWLTAYPSGAIPSTSTLNFDPSEYAMANGAIIGLGSNGQLCVNVGTTNNAPGGSHIVIDVVGYLE
jgi:hypothetical protein